MVARLEGLGKGLAEEGVDVQVRDDGDFGVQGVEVEEDGVLGFGRGGGGWGFGRVCLGDVGSWRRRLGRSGMLQVCDVKSSSDFFAKKGGEEGAEFVDVL